MARLSAIFYGSDFAVTAGYLVNGAGFSAGDDEVTVDSGSGGVPVGTVVRFAGHDGVYLVKEGITGAAGTLTLNRDLEADLSNNAAVSILALTKIEKVLDAGSELSDEESIDYRVLSEQEEQNGVRADGQFYALGDDLPTVGESTWLRVTDGSGYFLYGGNNGCSIRRGKSGPKRLSDGPRYECVKFSCTGKAYGSTIQNT